MQRNSFVTNSDIDSIEAEIDSRLSSLSPHTLISIVRAEWSSKFTENLEDDSAIRKTIFTLGGWRLYHGVKEWMRGDIIALIENKLSEQSISVSEAMVEFLTSNIGGENLSSLKFKVIKELFKFTANSDEEAKKIIQQCIVALNKIVQIKDKFRLAMKLYSSDIDSMKAFDLFKSLASTGHADSLVMLGDCYSYGTGIVKNIHKAIQYYKKAAEQGHIEGEYNLGFRLFDLALFDKEIEEAVKWLQKAADKDHPRAQFRLAECYRMGNGAEQNEKKAFDYYHKAAEKGDRDAQYRLGILYLNGEGTDINNEEGLKWLHVAAANGHINAQYKIGECYFKGSVTARNYKKAFEWFQKAAEGESSDAFYYLGHCYLKGKGTKNNNEEAFKWFQKAADKGDVDAQLYLGECYFKGLGTKVDHEKAFEWFKKSASRGKKIAEYILNKKISFNINFIIEQAKESTDCYVFCDFLIPVDQIDIYCGSAAFATGMNYSKCIPFPLYASVYEKEAAGQDITQTDDIVLYQLSHHESLAEFRTNGPQFNIHSFQKEAELYKSKEECEVIKMNDDITEEEYAKIIKQAIRNKYLLIVPCDVLNEMPGQRQGNTTHWVLAIGYLRDKNGVDCVVVTHHGKFCLWPIHELYLSNKQIPKINPRFRKLSETLDEFRFRLFKIPVIGEREVIKSEAVCSATHRPPMISLS